MSVESLRYPSVECGPTASELGSVIDAIPEGHPDKHFVYHWRGLAYSPETWYRKNRLEYLEQCANLVEPSEGRPWSAEEFVTSYIDACKEIEALDEEVRGKFCRRFDPVYFMHGEELASLTIATVAEDEKNEYRLDHIKDRTKRIPQESYKLVADDLKTLVELTRLATGADNDDIRWVEHAPTPMIRHARYIMEAGGDPLSDFRSEDIWSYAVGLGAHWHSHVPEYDSQKAELLAQQEDRWKLCYRDQIRTIILGPYGEHYLKNRNTFTAIQHIKHGKPSPHSRESMLAHPWLISHGDMPETPFPHEGHMRDKTEWLFAEHADALPASLRTSGVGKVLLNRLDRGADESTYSQRQWLREMESITVPYDTRKIMAYVLGRVIEDPTLIDKLPANPRRFELLFPESEDVALTVSRRASEGCPKKQILEEVKAPGNYNFVRYMDRLISDSFEAESSFDDLLSRLKSEVHDYRQRTAAARTWLMRHGDMADGMMLAYAWNNRDQALQAGHADNPSAIVAGIAADRVWEELALPPEKVEKYGAFVTELVRCYPSNTVSDAIAKLDRFGTKSRQVIPPDIISLEDGLTFEVLPPDDPRGFTIGPDAGCCMSLPDMEHDSDAESGIWAGYQSPYYAFGVVTDARGRAFSHGLLFAGRRAADRNTLVIDSIEASSGRNPKTLTQLYMTAFQQYCKRHPEFKRVHIGAEGGKAYLKNLVSVHPVAPPRKTTYTDAQNQLLLWEAGSSSQPL